MNHRVHRSFLQPGSEVHICQTAPTLLEYPEQSSKKVDLELRFVQTPIAIFEVVEYRVVTVRSSYGLHVLKAEAIKQQK